MQTLQSKKKCRRGLLMYQTILYFTTRSAFSLLSQTRAVAHIRNTTTRHNLNVCAQRPLILMRPHSGGERLSSFPWRVMHSRGSTEGQIKLCKEADAEVIKYVLKNSLDGPGAGTVQRGGSYKQLVSSLKHILI